MSFVLSCEHGNGAKGTDQMVPGVSVGETDLEEAAEVVQGTLGPQEAPGQNRADLITHRVEMSDEAVGHLRRKAEVTKKHWRLITAL